MVTIFKVEESGICEDVTKQLFELRGLSDDNKPTEINGKTIENGSQFIEIDTGKVYLYDLSTETWNEV